MADVGAWNPDLDAVARALWADAELSVGHDRTTELGHEERYLALPSLRRPRYLMSGDLSALAVSRTLRHYNSLRARGPRYMRSALATLARAGWLPGRNSQVLRVHTGGAPGSLLRLRLAEELDRDPAELGLACGVRVAHGVARPVVTVVDRDGDPLLFVKSASTPLHQRRLRREHEMLVALTRDPVPGVHTPRPIFLRSWGSTLAIGVAPLPVEVMPMRPGDTGPANIALESITGPRRRTAYALTDSPWLAAVRDRARFLPAAAQDQVLEAVERVLRDHAGTTLPHAPGHGDWSFWNMGRLPSTGVLALWDWEFGDLETPVGLDQLHWPFALATTVRGMPVSRFLSRRRSDLHGRPPEVVAVLALHTLEMGVRRLEETTVGDPEALTDAREVLELLP